LTWRRVGWAWGLATGIVARGLHSRGLGRRCLRRLRHLPPAWTADVCAGCDISRPPGPAPPTFAQVATSCEGALKTSQQWARENQPSEERSPSVGTLFPSPLAARPSSCLPLAARASQSWARFRGARQRSREGRQVSVRSFLPPLRLRTSQSWARFRGARQRSRQGHPSVGCVSAGRGKGRDKVARPCGRNYCTDKAIRLSVKGFYSLCS